MGASISPTSRRGGRRPLDAALNLVPFIDLLSCCIAFLLITAVWSQLSSVSARTAIPGGDPVGVAAPTLNLRVHPDGWTLTPPLGTARSIPHAAGRQALLEALDSMHRLQLSPVATLTADDNVGYQQVVAAMDALVASGFHDVQFGGG